MRPEGTSRLCPISDTWQNIPVTDPEHAREIWSQHPYGVLLVCGHSVDVLELPYRIMGLLSAFTGEGLVAPVAVTGRHRSFSCSRPPIGTSCCPLRGGAPARGWLLDCAISTPTDLVLTQRWWTTPVEDQLLLPTQVVLDTLRSTGTGLDDEQE